MPSAGGGGAGDAAAEQSPSRVLGCATKLGARSAVATIAIASWQLALPPLTSTPVHGDVQRLAATVASVSIVTGVQGPASSISRLVGPDAAVGDQRRRAFHS